MNRDFIKTPFAGAANICSRLRLTGKGVALAALGAFVLAVPAAYAHAQDSRFVYTESNAASNSILVFHRGVDGTLTQAAIVPTGGLGGGVVSVGSQGALAISPNGRWLVAVNEGDNTVSLLERTRYGLRAVDKVSSDGTLPVSVTISRNLVYVLNDGGSGKPANISGFYLDGQRGALYPIAHSSRYLSAKSPTPPAVGPVAPEIGFDRSGSLLYVTEVGTSLIDKYTIGDDGTPSVDDPQPSFGDAPFAFAFDPHDNLLVTEIHETTLPSFVSQGAVTSYKLNRGGYLIPVSGSVPDDQTAPCWLAISGTGKYAYTVNTGSSVISGYRIDDKGELWLLGNGVAAQTGPHPLDVASTRDSRYLYNVSGSGTLVGFQVQADGSLTPLSQVSTIPTTARGLVAE